jgi:2-polyprenyl-6-methoxyphenol hydroxylase-like FAD-dependent oxidoreductase
MAIEDAASIAQLLPEHTPAVDIPDRVQLYEQVRHERASFVQEQTRINGLNEDKRPAAKGGFDMLLYCHNFDEWQNSAEKLEEHLKAKAGTSGTS